MKSVREFTVRLRAHPGECLMRTWSRDESDRDYDSCRQPAGRLTKPDEVVVCGVEQVRGVDIYREYAGIPAEPDVHQPERVDGGLGGRGVAVVPAGGDFGRQSAPYAHPDLEGQLVAHVVERVFGDSSGGVFVRGEPAVAYRRVAQPAVGPVRQGGVGAEGVEGGELCGFPLVARVGRHQLPVDYVGPVPVKQRAADREAAVRIAGAEHEVERPFGFEVRIADMRGGRVVKIGECRQAHRPVGRKRGAPTFQYGLLDAEAPGGECAVGAAGYVERSGERGRAEIRPVAQPAVHRIALLAFGVESLDRSRNGDRRAEILPEHVAQKGVVAPVDAERRDASRPVQVAAHARSDIVGRMMVGVPSVGSSAAGAVEFVAVLVAAVVHVRIECHTPHETAPPQRGQCRFGVLELVWELERIEAVRPEVAPLVAGLEVEHADRSVMVGDACEQIGIEEVRVGHVAVRAAYGSGGQHGQSVACDGSREIGIEVAVRSARYLGPHVIGAQRRGGDVDGSGVGSDASQSPDNVYRADRFGIHRQAVALVAGAGIREVDAVEKDHRLIRVASPDGEVGLYSLAAPFADVDYRVEPEYAFDGLRRCGERFISPVHLRGRHSPTRGILEFLRRDGKRLDGLLVGDPQRVGTCCHALGIERDDRHRDGENADSHNPSER